MRYVRAAKSFAPLFVEPLWDDQALVPDVRVSEHEAVNTGLLFADGTPVMRVNDPIGFGRENER